LHLHPHRGSRKFSQTWLKLSIITWVLVRQMLLKLAWCFRVAGNICWWCDHYFELFDCTLKCAVLIYYETTHTVQCGLGSW
jgi:hypothetical protein